MTSNAKKSLFWDAKFPVLKLTGDGCRKFLHGQTTSDILGVKDECLIRTCWLTSSGRLRSILEINLRDKEAQIVVLAGKIKDLLIGFDRVIFPSDQVSIESTEEIRRVQKMSFETSWKESHTEWLPEDKSLPKLFNGFSSANDKDIHEWRLRQGMLIGPNEIDAETIPYEIGLSDLISLDKGCYLGQEAMARLKRIGRLKRQLRFWISVRNNDIETLLEIKGNNSINNSASIISNLYLGNETNIGLAMVRNKFLSNKEVFISEEYKFCKIYLPIGFHELSSN